MPKSSTPASDSARLTAAQWYWFERARRELHSPVFHDVQAFALRMKGVKAPKYPLALFDPQTADPHSFALAGKKRQTDVSLLAIQVLAAIALEVACKYEGLSQESCDDAIVNDLRKVGLRGPGERVKAYMPGTAIKWRQRCNRGDPRLAELYRDGLAIFRRFCIPWRAIVGIACDEARLRAALHKLHHDDPKGKNAGDQFRASLSLFPSRALRTIGV